MPRAEILTTQAMHTLRQLHAELGGKIIDNKLEADRLRLAMQQVEAVMRMLDPTCNIRSIAVRRRKPNPWFKRGTVFRAALDVLRGAERPLTTREIAGRMIASKGVEKPSDHDRRSLEGAVQSSLRNHQGGMVEVCGSGMPAKWALKIAPALGVTN